MSAASSIDRAGEPTVSGLLRPITNMAAADSTGFAVIGSATGGYRTSTIIVPFKVTLTKVKFQFNVSSGNVDGGIYTRDGLTKLASSGSVAMAGLGGSPAELTLTSPLTIDAGEYIVALSSDNATATILIGSDAALALQGQAGTATGAGTFPLPATVNTPGSGSTSANVPCLGVR